MVELKQTLKAFLYKEFFNFVIVEEKLKIKLHRFKVQEICKFYNVEFYADYYSLREFEIIISETYETQVLWIAELLYLNFEYFKIIILVFWAFESYVRKCYDLKFYEILSSKKWDFFVIRMSIDYFTRDIANKSKQISTSSFLFFISYNLIVAIIFLL